MIVLDANVVIGFLDRSNVHHVRAMELLQAHEGESFVMHQITLAEVLAGPAQIGAAEAEKVWAAILRLGVVQALTETTPLAIARLRAESGLPIPDCLVLLAAGEPAAANRILTFDGRLATKARQLGYEVSP